MPPAPPAAENFPLAGLSDISPDPAVETRLPAAPGRGEAACGNSPYADVEQVAVEMIADASGGRT